MRSPMSLELVLASIAQGAINIEEGLEVVERGSRVHEAMLELCRYVHEDRDAVHEYLEGLET